MNRRSRRRRRVAIGRKLCRREVDAGARIHNRIFRVLVLPTCGRACESKLRRADHMLDKAVKHARKGRCAPMAKAVEKAKDHVLEAYNYAEGLKPSDKDGISMLIRTLNERSVDRGRL